MAARTDVQRTGTFQWGRADDNTWDPTASPHMTATGGGGGGNEVAIQPLAPTESGIELWVDDDELPLVSTPVYVQPDQPDLSDLPTGSPLWLDTDEEPVIPFLLERIEALESRLVALEVRGV